MASSYGTDAGKASLRTSYLDLCERMPKDFTARIDGTVRDMLARLDVFAQADLVLGYVPTHEEIDTTSIHRDLLAAGKRLALPYLDAKSNKLAFYEVDSLDSLPRGARGIGALPSEGAEPLTTEDMLGSVCLVPGLVFDGEGYRLGCGAGYYDEFLSLYPGHKIGLVRSVQVSSNPLPHDDHDIPVDVLVTEGSIWRCRKLF